MMSRLPAYGGQEVAVAFDFEEYRDPRVSRPALLRFVELWIGAQGVAGYVLLDVVDQFGELTASPHPGRVG